MTNSLIDLAWCLLLKLWDRLLHRKFLHLLSSLRHTHHIKLNWIVQPVFLLLYCNTRILNCWNHFILDRLVSWFFCKFLLEWHVFITVIFLNLLNLLLHINKNNFFIHSWFSLIFVLLLDNGLPNKIRNTEAFYSFFKTDLTLLW